MKFPIFELYRKLLRRQKNYCIWLWERRSLCHKKSTESGSEGHQGILYVPAKAANAGGVAVSGLEMAQNASRASWSYGHVDRKLQEIMHYIFEQCFEASQQYGAPGNLLLGANIAGFVKVAKAMQWQGVV